VQRIAVRPDAGLDLDDAARKIGPKTRLVAVGAASNLSGAIQPVTRLAALARQHGALSYVDAVHWAPHLRLDVRRLGADFVACSAYKFFGPHVGLLWGRRVLLEETAVDKVRPAPDHGAEKWQTGTANFAAIAGVLAAIDYLAALGREVGWTPPSTRSSGTSATCARACSKASPRCRACACSASPTRRACASAARRCRSPRTARGRTPSPPGWRRGRCIAGRATATQSR
jgi:selenocysteine lyase/cysteine desulfurase